MPNSYTEKILSKFMHLKEANTRYDSSRNLLNNPD